MMQRLVADHQDRPKAGEKRLTLYGVDNLYPRRQGAATGAPATALPQAEREILAVAIAPGVFISTRLIVRPTIDVAVGSAPGGAWAGLPGSDGMSMFMDSLNQPQTARGAATGSCSGSSVTREPFVSIVVPTYRRLAGWQSYRLAVARLVS
jgi:hypothetical protein